MVTQRRWTLFTHVEKLCDGVSPHVLLKVDSNGHVTWLHTWIYQPEVNSVCPRIRRWSFCVVFHRHSEVLFPAIFGQHVRAVSLEVEWSTVECPVMRVAEHSAYTGLCSDGADLNINYDMLLTITNKLIYDVNKYRQSDINKCACTLIQTIAMFSHWS